MQAVAWSSNLQTAIRTLKNASAESLNKKLSNNEYLQSLGLSDSEQKHLKSVLNNNGTVVMSQWF